MLRIEKWDGKPIDRPGAYSHINMANYHGQLTVSPSISSTGIRMIWAKSAAHYYVSSYLNPNAIKKDKPEFAFGRAAHKLIIEGQAGFWDEYAVRPPDFSDFRSKAAQEWRDRELMMGKTILTPEELANISGMAKSLGSHPLVKAGILDGMIERTLVWKDKDAGVWIKARPDVIPESGADLVDLKTTQSVDDDSIQRSITNFAYHIQGAVAIEAVRETQGIQPQSFTLVFVEKAPPWAVRIVTIAEEDIARGIDQMKWAVREFARCVEKNEWPSPGFTSDAEVIGLSAWARHLIDDRLAVLKAMGDVQ